LLTGQARAALQGADVVIGYDGYFTWVADLVRDKECIALPLTQEVARAQLAVERALAGQVVSVISSGDAGVYGMASLVLEGWSNTRHALLPEVVVIPGDLCIECLALPCSGPIAHDFAVLSLSDLLTPGRDEKRQQPRQGGFCHGVLNPKSPGGSGGLRGPAPLLASIVLLGPVGLVRNTYRPQSVMPPPCRAGAGPGRHATTVIVGISQTRCFSHALITPGICARALWR
jgi:precorrin-3B C17-methyltransferase